MDTFTRKLRRCCAALAVENARRTHYDESGDGRAHDDATTAGSYTDDDRVEVMTLAHEWLVNHRGSVGQWDYMSDDEIELVMHDVVSEVVRVCKG